MKIYLKTDDELVLMLRANRLVSSTLAEVARHIRPGVTTLQLNAVAETFIRDHGAEPTFRGVPCPFGGEPFPGILCTSINDVVVHGIPSATDELREGDLISVDCGVRLDGFCGDSAYTFAVGPISSEAARLLRATRYALEQGIAAARMGGHIGDIGAAVSAHCQSETLGVVREFTGHGIGRSMHEDPSVPNVAKAGSGTLIKAGMCLSIEPMVTLGSPRVGICPDRWTIRTVDGSLAAHFEHTVAVRRQGVEVLSSFEEIDHIVGQPIVQ